MNFYRFFILDLGLRKIIIATQMKICVNIRMVRPDGMDGIGWFSFEIIKRWISQHPEHEFILLCDRRSVKKMLPASNAKVKVIYPPARTLSLINWWNKSAKIYVNRIKPDVFVSMDGQFSHPIKVPVLNVIHDLNFLHHPEWMTKAIAKFYNNSIPKCAEHATRLATVSEYSKADIAASYGIPPNKIDVVYNGFNMELLNVQNSPNKEHPFFLFVGIQVPRKNIIGLIKSFSIFKETYGTNHKLKLAGHDYLWNTEMLSTLENSKFKSDIELLGRQTFDNLKTLYSSAEALLYVPHFEGFGIPVLEGFAAGIPVICSNTTSVPEVAGDAALQCAPTDYTSVSEAMHKVISDETLRLELIEKGRKRLELFNWEKTATALWQSLEKTLEK